MKVKKFIAVASLVIVAAAVAVGILIMWSQGVFSGSPALRPRNTALEAVVAPEADRRIEEAFSKHPELGFVSVKSSALLYTDEYGETADPSGEEKAFQNASLCISAELTLRGKALTYDEYKAFAYKAAEVFKSDVGFKPSALQLFYMREPGEGETEDVMEYESRIPNYLFDVNESYFLSASQTHFIVEVDEELALKTRVLYITRTVVILTIAVTVVALTVLMIVRHIRRQRRYRRGEM